MIVQAEAIQFMSSLEKDSVDMILSDPPYGIGFNDGDMNSALGRIFKDRERVRDVQTIQNDKPEDYENMIRGFLREGRRILKPGGVAAVFCSGGGGPDKDGPTFSKLAMWMAEVFDFRQAVVWDKGGLGLGLRYRRNYEFVMVANKLGAPMKWYDTSNKVANIVKIGKIIPDSEQHPTEKPIEIFEFFIKLHTQENDLVLDPFCGSGTCGVACEKLCRRFIGVDLDNQWAERAKLRIEAVRSNIAWQDIRNGQKALFPDDAA